MTSRDFENLEKKCKVLNRRKYIKWFFTIFILFSMLALAYYIPNIKNQIGADGVAIHYKKSISNEIKESKVMVVKPKQDTDINRHLVSESTKVKRVKIEKMAEKGLKKPKENQSSVKKKGIEYDTIFLKPKITIPKSMNLEKTKKRKNKIMKPKETIFKDSVGTHKKKVVIEVKSLKDEEALLRDNRVSENFNTTIRLSKYYYNQSKFQKAIYWSKKANQYKPSLFKPWRIYAKAKIKQGKKRDAIRAVETFLSYFDSVDARKFLIKIKGKQK